MRPSHHLQRQRFYPGQPRWSYHLEQERKLHSHHAVSPITRPSKPFRLIPPKSSRRSNAFVHRQLTSSWLARRANRVCFTQSNDTFCAAKSSTETLAFEKVWPVTFSHTAILSLKANYTIKYSEYHVFRDTNISSYSFDAAKCTGDYFCTRCGSFSHNRAPSESRCLGSES